jgi:ribosomal protein L16/L10AE
MGKGKGQIAYWGVKVYGGTVLFEVCGTSLNTILSALKTGGTKLPIKTRVFN